MRRGVTSTAIAVVAVALLLAACAPAIGAPSAAQPSSIGASGDVPTDQATPSPTAEPTIPEWVNRTPSAECVTPPPDLMTVIFQADPVGCYGDADLALEGIVLAIGAYEPLLMTEPAWLGMPEWTLQAIVDEARGPSVTLVSYERGIARPSSWGGPDLWIVVDPATGIDLATYDGQIVEVIGHFNDRVAPTCHYTEDYSDIGVAPEGAAEHCRKRFVVTEIGQ